VLLISEKSSVGLRTSYEEALTDYAIRAEGLTKQYTIGARSEPYRTLREALTMAMSAPFRHLGNLRGPSAPTNTLLALKDVNFQINRGEVVGVIGRNGAGKSTLLKILSRITLPSEGRVAVRGRVASLLEVGTGFHPELTGRENVFLNGAILGMTRFEVRQKFDEIVAFADVDRFIDTPVKHYSSGMYMRLAFAIAAHLETDILLVDEVLAVGDASFQQKCLAKMQDVAGHGRTVLFVSHNMTAVQSLCQRAIHFSSGQIKGDGDPRIEIQNYLQSTTVDQTKRRRLQLGDALAITDFSIAPNPVESRRDLQFRLTLSASSAVRIVSAVLLLDAREGPRIGVVDLRGTGFPFQMKTGDRLQIEGRLCSLPLVEREYRINLWIDSGEFVGEVTDLADLTVSPAVTDSKFTPSAPQHRGWMEFDIECSARVSQDHTLVQAVQDAEARAVRSFKSLAN
jgi:lipopolysaccharide transport system ATP-binding protein